MGIEKELLTTGQRELLESVHEHDEQSSPRLPSGVTDLAVFRQQFSELRQYDPSRMNDIMKRSGATTILCEITLPQPMYEKITKLLRDEYDGPDAQNDTDIRDEFTSQELRFGKFIYGCLLGMSAPELEQYMHIARRVDQWDGKTIAPFPTYSDEELTQSENGAVLRFALDQFAVGALNEIRRQTTTTLSDVDIIALAIDNSLDNNAIPARSNTCHLTSIAKEAETNPNRCKKITFYMDEGHIKLAEGFALMDYTGIADQIRKALVYVLAQAPSLFTLQSMVQSPNLTKGRPVTVLIDISTCNELHNAGFTDKQISRLLSAAMFVYFDARLNDPDLEQKMADASVVHDTLHGMLASAEELGIAKTVVDEMIKGHQAEGKPLNEAILMAYEKFQKTHGPKVLEFPHKICEL